MFVSIHHDNEIFCKWNQVLHLDYFSHPSSKLAAVLVLLRKQEGNLRVLLTTRSKALRTHASQTAFHEKRG